MKKLLLLAILSAALNAFGAGEPYLRNSYDTNAPGRAPNILSTSTNPLYPLMVQNPDGSGSDTREIQYSSKFHINNGIGYYDGYFIFGTNVQINGLDPGTMLAVGLGVNRIINVTMGTGLTYNTSTATLSRDALTGDVTTSGNAATIAAGVITDTQINGSAGIAWSKISKVGSSLADLATASAGDLSSGTLPAARMPALTGDVTTSAGAVATTIANNAVTDAKFRQGVARSVVGVTGNSTANTADIQGTTDQVLRVSGAGTALGFGAIDLSKTAAATGVLQAASFPALTGDVTTSAGSLATTVANVKSAAAGGSATVKLKQYIVLAFPHSCDGVGAIIYTNDNTKAYFGQASFSGSAATNGNYVEYRLTVPEDIDTSVDLKVERWKVRLGAADTSAQSYNIGMASVADSAGYDSPTIGQWVAINIAADGSGASGDVETVSNVTLTSWKSNVTAGQLWVIRVNRDGAGDASTQAAYSGPLIISYGSTQ